MMIIFQSLLLLSPLASGFVIPTSSSTPSSTQLYEKKRIESVGGGIPIVPSGDNQLFDPNLEGKLGNTQERIAAGVNYHLEHTEPPNAAVAGKQDLMDCQDWLEDLGLPLNFAKPQAPVEATVLGRTRLIGTDAPGDIQHVVLQLPSGMHYVEGQSLSVIPPGVTDKGKPHKPRLYSIASTRYVDLLDGSTVSLCVRKAEYTDPVTNQVDPTKAGVCSSFLCNTQPGDTVQVAGPVGKTMLLPSDPSKDIIMVATGTGIAPFRAFLHRLFVEETVAKHLFTGHAWLILGVPVTSGLLYPQELSAMQCDASSGKNGGTLTIDYAISREQTNSINGGKRYVQHVLQEQASELLTKMQNGAVIYFCGLKGMMPGILEALEQVCQERGLDFQQELKSWKDNNQWHVEVY